jgi:hypothetical protein
VTEQLLAQQLESPSGTGRDEPRSQISLPARTNTKRGCKPALAFSLAVMARAVQMPSAATTTGQMRSASAACPLTLRWA